VVVFQRSNELEVVLQANTDSYVGFGWKPSSEQHSFVFTSILIADCDTPKVIAGQGFAIAKPLTIGY